MSTIALFCREDTTTRILIDAKPSMFSATPVEDWVDFRKRVAPVDGAIIVAGEQDGHSLGHDIRAVSEQFPLKTIVVAAHRNARLPVVLDNYITVPSQADTRTGRYVWEEYYYAWVCTRLQMLALALGQAGLSSLVTVALTNALRTRKPFVSVTSLSAFTGINRKTLWRHWDTEVQPLWPVRLIDALDWITLMHLVARKTPDRTWTSLAEWVGLNVRTLSRQTKKLTGHTLSDLEGLEKEAIFRAFVDQIDHLLTKIRA